MSNVNLEPFELSLWKDKLVEKIIPNDDITEDSLINIYRGLNTDEKDLSFWYLPRRWKGAKFNPISDDNKYKVNVDIDSPSERENSLVHVDFSTSNLDFKPNTYYTFLLHLDFSKSTHKLPNWDSYIKYNPDKVSHYLISLIRQDVPDSQWNMPKPIFDSSVVLSYNMNGFNLLNSELNNNDSAKLFVYKDNNVVEHVILTCFAKTNNFLSEKATVGMWSFLEAWVEDYWNADMEIYAFEEIIEKETVNDEVINTPKIYNRILKSLYGDIDPNISYSYKETQGEQQNDGTLRTFLIRQLFGNDGEGGILREIFPFKDGEENIPMAEDSNFYNVYTEINNEINNYYNKFMEELSKYYYEKEITITEDDTTSTQIEKGFRIIKGELPEKIGDYTTDDIKNFISKKIIILIEESSKKVAEIFNNYFPGLAFPYRIYNYTNDSFTTEQYYQIYDNKRTLNIENFFNSLSTFLPSNFLDNFLINENFLVNFFNKTFDPNSNDSLITLSDIMEESETVSEDINITYLYFNIRDEEDNILSDISKVYTFLDEYIKQNSNIQTFWGQLCSNNENKIYDYLKYMYYSNGYLYNYNWEKSENNNNIIRDELGFIASYGSILARIPIFHDFLIWFKSLFIDKISDSEIAVTDYFKPTLLKSRTRRGLPQLFLGILLLYNNFQNLDLEGNLSDSGDTYRVILLQDIEDFTEYTGGSAYIYLKCLRQFYTLINEKDKKMFNKVNNYFISIFNEDCFEITEGRMGYFEENILNNITIPEKAYLYLKEEKQFIFGEQGGPPSFVQEISFNENTKDIMHSLTFSLYNDYYDRKGKLVKNPYIDLIHEEDKIKYHYKNKWYDLIITDTQLDNISNKITYTAKDANVIELSKIGFNKTFNTELDNNVGTIDELTETAVKDTGWEVDNGEDGNMEKFFQALARPVIGGYIRDNWSIKLLDYYYDETLEKIDLDLGVDDVIILDSGSFIYLFYNDDFSSPDFKIIIPNLNLQEHNLIRKNNYTKLNNVLTDINLYPSFKIENTNNDIIPMVVDHIIPNTNITVSIPGIIDLNREIIFDYSLRANDIVTKPVTHYSVPLKRYVTEYTHTIGEEETETLYGYVESEYTTKSLVQNLLSNGEDFTSLDGWITGATNNIWKMELNLGAATKNNELNTTTPYINFLTSIESGGNVDDQHGFICNTTLGYNFSALDNLTVGDELVLRMQIERGGSLDSIEGSTTEIFDSLVLMDSIRPYIYAYNNSFTLQSKNDSSVLPMAKDQVMTFIQEQRYIDQIKYDSGQIENSTSFNNNGESVYDDIYDLEDTETFGLVPIYYARTSYAQTSGYLAAYPNENTFSISDYPCAYITKKLAKIWARGNNPYIRCFYKGGRYGSKVVTPQRYGTHKTYFFTDSGWDNFKKLFITNDNSAFNLRDFPIVANMNSNDFSSSDDLDTTYINYNKYPNQPLFRSNMSTNLKYYLLMLFSDQELYEKIKGITGPTEVDNYITSNNFNKKFLKFSYSSDDDVLTTWQDILEEKEYYELDKRNSGEQYFIPYNTDITFIDDNVNGIYYHTTNINDFDILMRARMHWYCKQYSQVDTCIFETSGIFCGKPVLNNNEYMYRRTEQINYTHEDLLDIHLGLFFTFDPTLYDDGGHGDSRIAFTSMQLFKKYLDSNGELILPNKIIESNTTPIYYLYNPEKNKNIIDKNDIKYDYIGSYLDDSYKINIDLTGEKKNSITITESNVYNILQKLAEIFDAWLVINVEHNEDGSIKLNENYKPIKKIYFINSRYNDNFAGIKYGVNLNKIDRKIDSNDIINKLNVKNNNNEFGKNKICSIVRSKYNLNGSNSIFNLDYLISINPLFEQLKEKLYNEIYPRTSMYGLFLSDLIDQLAQQTIVVSQTKATLDYNKMILNNAQDKLQESLDKYNSLSNVELVQLPSSDSDLARYEEDLSTAQLADRSGKPTKSIGYYIANNSEKTKLPTSVQNIINTFVFYNNLVNGFAIKYNTSIKEYNAANSKYSILQDARESTIIQRDSLLDEFQSLCAGRIREGAWSSEDYIDDDLYYLDGERQLKEFSVPRVSYTIDIVDLSSLQGYEAYDFNLRDKTTIEDPEIFGYIDKYTPVKEEIIITEKTTYPQSPEKNQIVVQNYKTNFSDLFQRMASTIQAVELGTLHYSNTNSSESIDARVTNNESNIQAFRKYNNL